MDEARIAQHAHEPTTREDRWRAIQERTTRGMLTFNAGGVVRLEEDCWAVRSATHGGFYRVDLDAEVCDCPDFEHFGSEHDVCCRHLFAAAIAHATRRRGPRRPSPRWRCAGCGRRHPRRDMVELAENNHDNLTYFHGDHLCPMCADGAGVEY